MESNQATVDEQIQSLVAAGRLPEALRQAREQVRRDRTRAQSWSVLGDVLEHSDRPAAAWRAFDRAWILDPQARWVEAARMRLEQRHHDKGEPAWMSKLLETPTVSIAGVIIARDEAATIEETVRRLLPAVDRVMVFDTGSSDDTPLLASKAGADVRRMEWPDDFAAARNAALREVTEQWVLWVDADEWLYPEDEAVPRWVAGVFNDRGPLVVRIVQMNKVGDRISPFYAASRLFPTRYGLRWWGPIHEQIGPPKGGPYAQVYPRPAARIRVYHEGYDQPEMERKQKLARNIRLLSRQVERDPEDVTCMSLLGRELQLTGEIEAAIDAYRKAEALAERMPNFSAVIDVRFGLAHALMATGDLAEAKAVADRLVASAPEYPGGWYVKGAAEVAMASEFLVSAQQAFRRTMAVWPSYRGFTPMDATIPEHWAEVGLADALTMSGDWVHGAAFYRQALARTPDNTAVRSHLEAIADQVRQLVDEDWDDV